ncbi:MAG: dihydrofolate reductase family protein [Chitinophagaceae bacterium]|nr:dihydrofolate reductase family protein [Chitinophagaceae bacterium]
MRKLIFFMHASLDGFVAGPNGELDWIMIEDEIFDFVDTMTDQADAALYGRITYDIMQSYWPTAADQPDATKHDKKHAAWYQDVSKIVLSRTMGHEGLGRTTIISDALKDKIGSIKNQEGKNILIFGSPSASHALLQEGLIDEFWIFVNPVILGQGIPLFKGSSAKTKLNLIETQTFSCGVIALHYETKLD